MNEIDSLKKRVAELEKANRELGDIFNAVGDVIFVIDNNNTVKRVNASCTAFLKIKPQDVIGRKCYDVMHGLNHPWPTCPFEGAKQDHKIHVKEINDPKMGLSLLVTTSPILGEKGEMIGAVHAVKDVTEFHNTAKALSDSETKYKSIFNSSADAIMLLIPGDGFSGGNSAAVKLFGFKDEQDIISKSPYDLSPEYQPDGQLSSVKSQEMMRVAIEKGSNAFEWTHKRVNGEEFFATVLLTKMKLGNQTIIQAVIRDITERILAEKQLAKKLRDLEIFYKAAIDREIKIKELKKKVQELESKIKG